MIQARKIIIALLILVTSNCFAEGDRPRAELCAPTGVWGVNPKYLHLDQNLLPNGNILIDKCDESRSIDLKDSTRSIREIEFWFDTKGRLSDKARVTVYGKR